MLKELAHVSPTPYLNSRFTTTVAFIDNWRNGTRADLLMISYQPTAGETTGLWGHYDSPNKAEVYNASHVQLSLQLSLHLFLSLLLYRCGRPLIIRFY